MNPQPAPAVGGSALAAEPPTDPLDAPALPFDAHTPVAVARELAPLVPVGDALGDEVPEEPTLDVAPDRVVAEQAQRTDVALAQWRAESERRATQFRARAEVEDAQLAEKRRKLVLGMALGASAAVVVLAIGAGVVAAGRVVVEPAGPPARIARAARPVARPAPTAAPASAAATVAVSPAAAPAEVVVKAPRSATPERVVAAAAPAPVERGPVVRDGVVKVEHGFVFTEFRTPEAENVRITWRDAAHEAPLDPMGCGGARVDGLRTCKAGRSVTRIESALAAGAQPGQWTVEACVGAACTPVGTFSVPFAD